MKNFRVQEETEVYGRKTKGPFDMCVDRRQPEELFKIHTYNQGFLTKRGVYVQSEDCNSMGNLTLYVGSKKQNKTKTKTKNVSPS